MKDKPLTSVSGTKVWDDADNQDGKRPEAVTVRLLANGEELASAEVSAETDWTYSCTDLLKYDDEDALIAYTVVEDAVENYSTTYDGYTVINSYTPEQTSISVVKAWDDGNNKDGIRPDQVEVILLADGKKTEQTVVLSEANHWTASFTGLDVYRDGTAIVYTVEEVAVKDYQSSTAGDAAKGFVITNTHTPSEESKTKPGTPQTGDDAHLELYLATSFASLGAILLLVIFRRKQAKE
ncbi:MAG: Cna B-type domain-containing protein [Eubacterium sp.]|nr:Cna B-type domain-containing protein [Eubacterium sp.]